MHDSDNFLVNPIVQNALDSIVADPPHALLFEGRQGSGKISLTRMTLRRINPLIDIQVFQALESKSLGIDAMREIKSYMTSKSTSVLPTRAAVIVPAEAMTEEAQNALLKTLEEPAHGSMLVLLSRNSHLLLPTILSRVRKINILPISRQQAYQRYAEYDQATVNKAYIISEGAPQLLHAVIAQDEHPTIDAIKEAKEYLGMSRAKKLSMIDVHKDTINSLTDNIKHIVSSTLQNPDLSSQSRQSFLKIYKTVSRAETNLQAHVNKKAILLDMALHM